MFVAILVGMRQQRLFSVRLLDVRVGARRADALEAQDVVKGGGLAFPDSQHGGLLLDRVGAALVALIVFARASGTARVGAGGLGFWHLRICDESKKSRG